MDLSVLKFIAMGIAIGLGVVGPALGLGWATKAIIESIARQPEVEGQISKYFYIGAGLIEACAIYALLVVILIGFVLK
ncbi:MAG: ATP synthase F0 subunit C [Candidatus Gastranaerophilales bacterium]|nr:ATP synthase F0 subunit C [Candidatus Gastranaerophilales bacterium]